MANNGTIFQYNGVYIGPYTSLLAPTSVDVVSYSAESVMDDAQTNIMWKRYSLTVRGLVSGDISDLERTLMVPRAPLVYQFAGGNGPYAQANLPNGDDRTGPLPKNIKIIPMVGSSLVMVELTIEWELQNTCSETSPVLAFNYAQISTKDDQFLTTLYTNGSFKVRQSSNYNNPDLLRELAWFPLINGFQRSSSSFAVAQNGLDLTFSLVDKEMPSATFPKPLTACSASFSVSMDQYQWYNHFNARGKTHNQNNKLNVFSQLVAMAQSRMDFTTEIITQGTIGENLYDNECSLSLTTMVVSLEGGANGYFPSETKLFTRVPSTGQQELLGPYGSSLVAAAKTLWYDSCIGNTPQSPNLQGGSVSMPTLTIVVNSQGSGNLSQGGNSALNQKKSEPYILFSDNYEWEAVNNVVFMPAAAQGGGVSIYQCGDPYILTRHRGHAVRAKKPPPFPDFKLLTSGQSVILKNQLTTFAPELSHDHVTIEYGIKWDVEGLTVLSSSGLTMGATFESVGEKTPIPSPANPLINTTAAVYSLPKDANTG